MFILAGMGIIAWGAWTQAFHVEQPAIIGRTAVIVGSLVLMLALNAALRKSGGQKADRGGSSLWWLGMTVLVSCVSLMGLVYVTLVPDFGEIQQELVRGLLIALGVSETLRLLMFGLRRLFR